MYKVRYGAQRFYIYVEHHLQGKTKVNLCSLPWGASDIHPPFREVAQSFQCETLALFHKSQATFRKDSQFSAALLLQKYRMNFHFFQTGNYFSTKESQRLHIFMGIFWQYRSIKNEARYSSSFIHMPFKQRPEMAEMDQASTTLNLHQD